MKHQEAIWTPLVCAGQIMTKPLVTIVTGETMSQAAAILLDKGISGAPVVDLMNRPIGVITKTDIARYEREAMSSRLNVATRESMRTAGTLERIAQSQGFHRETEEDYVNHWMTPKVFSVSATASVASVVSEMGKRRIHRLFVRNEETGRMMGVITTFDLLKFLGRIFLLWPNGKIGRRTRGQKTGGRRGRVGSPV